MDSNWYEGERNAMVGIFPVTYVEAVPDNQVESAGVGVGGGAAGAGGSTGRPGQQQVVPHKKSQTSSGMWETEVGMCVHPSSFLSSSGSSGG